MGQISGGTLSMAMDAPYHKEQQCAIWFMGGDLNGFSNIKPFMK